MCLAIPEPQHCRRRAVDPIKLGQQNKRKCADKSWRKGPVCAVIQSLSHFFDMNLSTASGWKQIYDTWIGFMYTTRRSYLAFFDLSFSPRWNVNLISKQIFGYFILAPFCYIRRPFFRSLSQNSRASKLKLFINSTKSLQNSRILFSQNSIFRKICLYSMPELNLYLVIKNLIRKPKKK